MIRRKAKLQGRVAAEPRTTLVYSTDQGHLRAPQAPRQLPPGDGIVRVGRQTQGRKGKGVTIISGVPVTGAELAALGAELKRRCGSGGTVKDQMIEIQGDHRDLVVAELQKRGWTVRKSGG